MMATIWSRVFWKDAGERAIWTVAQTAGAAIVVYAGDAVIPAVGLEAVPWVKIASLSGLAGVLSVIKSLTVGLRPAAGDDG